jgi:serine/threonine protein kinase
MEFLEGRTIRHAVDEGPIPWQDAIRHVRDLLDALDRLHREGIVHRDLKPDNIIITDDGVIKLMDFGIAHVGTDKTLTVAGTTLGTVNYMSPEQAAGQKVDQRSDLFSIASVLYEMVTGKLPFEGEHAMSVMYLISNAPHKPLAEHDVEVPPTLDGILERAFEKEKEDRFPDAKAFGDALGALVEPAPGEHGAGMSRNALLLKVVLPAVVAVVAAIVILTQFIGRGPTFDRALAVNHNEQGQTLLDAGKNAEASIEFRKGFEADPTYAPVWNNLGVIAMREGYVEEADSVFGEAIRLNPTYAVAHFNRGNVRWDLGDSTKAEAAFRDAIAADSTLIGGYNNLAALLLDRGRGTEALAIIDVGLAKRPADPFLLKKKGQIAFAMKRDVDALTSLNTALAEAGRRSQDPRLAREVGSTPEVLQALQVSLHGLLGSWYERHGNAAEAEKHFLEALKSKDENERRQASEALTRIRSE